MDSLKLKTAPYFDAELSFLESLAEGFTPGEDKPFTLPEMQAIGNNVQAYYDSRADLSKPCNLRNGEIVQRVNQKEYWLVDGEIFIGQINLRIPNLPKHLLEVGGHIGYSIRPSMRGKGYATKMLDILLKTIDKKEYPYVLITCNEGNLSSRGVIENNGGILQDIIDTEYSPEHKMCRYHISI